MIKCIPESILSMNVGEFLDKYDSGFDEAFLEAGTETLAILE